MKIMPAVTIINKIMTTKYKKKLPDHDLTFDNLLDSPEVSLDVIKGFRVNHLIFSESLPALL